MNNDIIRSMLTIGETVAVEFKRCGNGIETDTYETVCSFLNRFGGDIFMGVLDDGSYTAKFVIEKDQMYVENANRALKSGYITPDNLEPNPKNPIIASFFRNIGYADQLGSGVRNLFKYTKYYSGKEPEFVEGDIFKIIVPLDDAYSYDYESKDKQNETVAESNESKVATKESKVATKESKVDYELNENEKKILDVLEKYPQSTQKEICEKTQIPLWLIKRILPDLQEKGILVRSGGKRFGIWKIQR